MKSAPFLILVLLISSFQSSNSFSTDPLYLKYQVHISSQNEIDLQLYLANQKFKFNSTLNGVLNEKLRKFNESCYEAVYNLNATLYTNIELPIFPSSGPISYSNSTLICSPSGIFSIFNTALTTNTFSTLTTNTFSTLTTNTFSTLTTNTFSTLTTNTFSTLTTNTFSSNITRMNYDLNLDFKGVKDYKDIKTAYFIGNATFNYNNNTIKLSSSTNFTLLSSLIDNIPVHFSANSSLEFYNNTGNIQRFKSKAFIEISLEDTNNSFIKNVRNFNIKEFETSTGVKFFIITNSSIESIQVLGETLEVNTSNSSNSFFYLVFGKKNLFIDSSKTNVDGNRMSFSLLYFVDYASLSFINSQKTVKINLGANVGYYSTTTSEAVNTNSSYIIMIAAVLAILSLAITIILFLRKRAKL